MYYLYIKGISNFLSHRYHTWSNQSMIIILVFVIIVSY